MIKAKFLTFMLSMFCLTVDAQLAEEEIPTNNISFKRVNHRRYEPKLKYYDFIYKPSTKNLLYGNPCAIDVTHRMGFQYVPLVSGLGKSDVGVFLNNTFVYTKLILTRSPFWKMILNRRLRKCRVKSGDGIG